MASSTAKQTSPVPADDHERAVSSGPAIAAAAHSGLRPLDFLYTLYLFTKSDLKTFVLPQAVFGIFSALAGPLITTNAAPQPFEIVMRIPQVLLWTWLNTLVFDLANQRLPEAVLEDKLNKPGRPLAAGHISPAATRRLLFLAIPITLGIVYWCLRGTEETSLLFCLTWMYNDLGGSDDHFLVRNLIIAVAYTLYGSGALRVACHPPACELNSNAVEWLALIGLVIFTTMHVQDLKDMVGDAARNRRTMPLSVGPTPTRYFLAGAITFWSVASPVYWHLDFRLAVLVAIFGGSVAVRLICLRSVAADTTSWKLWAYWLLSLYVLPWVQYLLHGEL